MKERCDTGWILYAFLAKPFENDTKGVLVNVFGSLLVAGSLPKYRHDRPAVTPDQFRFRIRLACLDSLDQNSRCGEFSRVYAVL